MPRLRVLHALHDFLPRHQAGSEIYAANLCRALAGRGHFPTVLCAEFDAARAHGQLSWRTHDGLPVVELVNNWQFASFDDTYASAALRRTLEHVLEIVQPHVLHVHNLLNLSFSLPRLARARGIPVVATLHDYTLICPSGGQRVHRAERHLCEEIDPVRCARCFPDTPYHTQLQLGRLARRSPGILGPAATVVRRTLPRAARAVAVAIARTPTPGLDPDAVRRRLAAAASVFTDVDLFVAPSNALSDEFRRLGLPAERLLVADYGFPPLGVTRIARRASSRLRLGFVGTLVWHKGVDILLDAVARLKDAPVETVIYGDTDVFPDYARHLRSMARDLPVTFAGPVSRSTLADAYADMDLLVVPSRWLENSPLVIHEAFMAGVPVIGARIGGIPGLVEHGISGLLFEPDSPASLEEVIRSVLDDPAVLTRLRASLPAVKTIDDDARDWEMRYEHVIAARGAASPGAMDAMPGREAS